MNGKFLNRIDAGRQLAELLEGYQGHENMVVLGLPRGGVPVAYEIAEKLKAPLDIYIVRKLGTPGQEELAMGAVASDGAFVLNTDVLRSVGISQSAVDRVKERELAEIRRREEEYRGGRQRVSLQGKKVLLVDDGLATGATMKAAVQAVRSSKPEKVIVAVGTTPPQTFNELQARDDIDEVVAVLKPSIFMGVGGSYEDFSQTTDDEVRDCLFKKRDE
ncbi:MAG: phosphoribosyltransferase family protein [Lentisphaeria bacterium]